jgi:hypothetical protein
MTIETMTTEQRNQAIEALGLTLTLNCINPGKPDILRRQKGEPSVWQYTLSRNGKSISGPYTMGCGLRVDSRGKPLPNRYKLTDDDIRILQASRPAKPTLADILYSLQSDANCAQDTFADFCAETGYDEDSRKALETYLACQAEGVGLRSLGLNLQTLGELFQDY